MNISAEQKKKLYKGLVVVVLAFLVAVGVSLLTESIRNGSNKPENTIVLSGHGEVTATPDIASVYFTISQDSKTVKDAQTLVAGIEKKSLDFLKKSNVVDKDIQTSDASFSPKYEYQYSTSAVPCSTYNCPPKPGKSVITGYTASESITVKVRNIDDVGKIMQGLGTLGVTNLSGPNFSIDNQDSLKAEARKKAIDDAKAKAIALAKDLGIHLGEITSFNESGNYPVPMYAKTMAADSVSGVSSASASIPTGENTITSDVTITYEIK